MRSYLVSGNLVAAAVLLLAVGCKSGQQAAKTSSTANEAIPRAVLGEWDSLHVSGVEETVRLTLRKDGSASMVSKTVNTKLFYRVEPVETWWTRRKVLLEREPKMKGIGRPYPHSSGVLVVMLGPNPNTIPDSGGHVMYYVPEKKILINPVTFLFVRPGQGMPVAFKPPQEP